jgi:hypothetical protein
MTITGSNTFNDLKYTATTPGTLTLESSKTQTVNGELELKGQSETARVLVTSSTLGTAATITLGGSATTDITHCNLRDITKSGTTLDLSAYRVGNMGGLTGITPTTGIDMFWIDEDGGNWNATTSWSSSSGDGSNSLVPLPQDTAKFDANSITSGSRTITLNLATICSIDCTNLANTPAMALSQAVNSYGSLKLVSGMTLSGNYGWNFIGRGSHTIDCGGKTLYSLTVDARGGTYTLAANLIYNSGQTFTLTSGTFDAETFNVTGGKFSAAGAVTRTLNMGSGNTWTMQSSNYVWSAGNLTGLTLNCETSTIKLTDNSGTYKEFDGAATITYYKLWIAVQGSGDVGLIRANTFNEIKIDAPNHADCEIKFGANQTVANFVASGNSSYKINIRSDTPGTQRTLTKTGGGTITCDYMDIKDSVGSPASTWYATNSTDSGNNSGWTFGAPGGTDKIAKVMGIAWASIAKINGISKASIAKFLGVSNT